MMIYARLEDLEVYQGGPWKLVIIVSKLVYKIFTGLTTYLYRVIYNPLIKYPLTSQYSTSFYRHQKQEGWTDATPPNF